MANPLLHNTQETSVNPANDLWPCLSQVKVPDLTNEMGYMGGKILADMGADIIKVEKPEEKGKSDESSIYQQIYDQENELYSLMYNAGKRSITRIRLLRLNSVNESKTSLLLLTYNCYYKLIVIVLVFDAVCKYGVFQ